MTIAEKFHERYQAAWAQRESDEDSDSLLQTEDAIQAEIWGAYTRRFQDDDFCLNIFRDGSGLANDTAYTRSEVTRWLPELKKDKTLSYRTPRGYWKNYAAYEKRKAKAAAAGE